MEQSIEAVFQANPSKEKMSFRAIFD
jgi:hypothetical protein